MADFFRKHKHFFISFSAVFIAGGALFLFLLYNIAAFVGYRPIWKSDFDEVVNLMVTYYDQSLHHTSTDASASDLLSDDDLRHRVQKDALSRIIEYKILAAGIEKVRPDWENLSEIKIAKAMLTIKESQQFEEGVKMLYGMEYDEFKYKVLMPQAQFEILSEELEKQGKIYEEWLKNQKENINIRIMVEGLKWENSDVAIK